MNTDRFDRRQIEKVEYENDVLTVTFSIPHEYGAVSYTESFAWGADYPPLFLKKAASDFMGAIVDAVNERVALKQEVPCGRCTGACCRNWDIRITQDDLNRLRSGGFTPLDMAELWPEGYPSIDGSIGVMKMVSWKGLDKKQEKACINLGPDGCKVYEFRPAVCRAYQGIGCDKVEEDPQKVKGLVQLRVKG